MAPLWERVESRSRKGKFYYARADGTSQWTCPPARELVDRDARVSGNLGKVPREVLSKVVLGARPAWEACFSTTRPFEPLRTASARLTRTHRQVGRRRLSRTLRGDVPRRLRGGLASRGLGAPPRRPRAR